jgi:hypothetical protein
MFSCVYVYMCACVHVQECVGESVLNQCKGRWKDDGRIRSLTRTLTHHIHTHTHKHTHKHTKIYAYISQAPHKAQGRIRHKCLNPKQ